MSILLDIKSGQTGMSVLRKGYRLSLLAEWDIFRRRHLPHLDRPGAPTFVTFRLAGSLPRDVLVLLMEQSRQWAKEYGDSEDARVLVHKRVFARFDKYLADNITQERGPLYLKDRAFAATVIRHLQWGVDNHRYLLHAWCVMPNHVHIVIETLPQKFTFNSNEISWTGVISRSEELGIIRFQAEQDRQECVSYGYWPLSRVMQGIKGVSAREINKLRDVTGSVWQDESFDHVILSEPEYYRVLDYISHNPVAAGLTSAPGEHQFTKILASIPDYAHQ